MGTEEKKPRQPRRSFTPEFKAEAVRLCRVGDRSIGRVASDLSIHDTLLRSWIRQADTDAGGGETGVLTTDERQELSRLRREVKRLSMERDVLKKATAFFVREST